MSRGDQSFTDFAAAAQPRLRRTAYLMCGDWHRASDLAQEALIRVYLRWPRLERRGSDLVAYARRALVTIAIDQNAVGVSVERDAYGAEPAAVRTYALDGSPLVAVRMSALGINTSGSMVAVRGNGSADVLIDTAAGKVVRAGSPGSLRYAGHGLVTWRNDTGPNSARWTVARLHTAGTH